MKNLEQIRAAAAHTTAPPAKFKVRAYPCGLRPGSDPAKLNQLLDELEAEEFAGRVNKQRKQARL